MTAKQCAICHGQGTITTRAPHSNETFTCWGCKGKGIETKHELYKTTDARIPRERFLTSDIAIGTITGRDFKPAPPEYADTPKDRKQEAPVL